MGVNGKQKGNSFERKIANTLSERFKNFLGVDQGFRRNPDSGSFFGGSNQARTETHLLESAVFGDLICPKIFKFSIECKHYKSAPTLESFISQNIKEWDGWLSQAEQDASNSGKDMMLIVKYNNVSELVFLKFSVSDFVEVKYKSYFIYKLSDILTLNDNFFFNSNLNEK